MKKPPSFTVVANTITISYKEEKYLVTVKEVLSGAYLTVGLPDGVLKPLSAFIKKHYNEDGSIKKRP